MKWTVEMVHSCDITNIITFTFNTHHDTHFDFTILESA